MIDLHTHSTASDGKYPPDQLVALAATAGVTTLALTDHDTVGGCAEAAAACARHDIEFVQGIEITAVASDRDVHVLAYFFDRELGPLIAFLDEQRRNRVDRVREMLARLEGHGIHLDAEAILAPGLADASLAVGRPWIARAMVEAGYVASIADAFDVWLGRGRPGFVPRVGVGPEDVFSRIDAAGGISSLAHPVHVEHDEWIPRFAEAGLDAIEAFHSDHDAADTARYLAVAKDIGLAVTGGSDFHADAGHGGGGPGSVSLPKVYFDQLRMMANR